MGKCHTVETLYNKVLWTGKFCLLYQVSCYISVVKRYQNKSLFHFDQRKDISYQVFHWIRTLYVEFPLYEVHWLQKRESRPIYY